MMSADLIVLAGIAILICAALIWVWKKRHRLFFNAKFTAETTMMNYQDDNKRTAMEAVEYMNEEAEEDEAGKKVKTDI